MTAEPDWLRPLLAEIFASKWSGDELPDFSTLQDTFVFHMGDAAAEIEGLSRLLRSRERPDKEQLTRVLRRFFLHAVPHLVAAGQLSDYVPSIFPEQQGVHSWDSGPGKDGSGAENRVVSRRETPGRAEDRRGKPGRKRTRP